MRQVVKIFYLIIVIYSLFVSRAESQDIQLSQFYSMPLYQNPAFAGSLSSNRASLHQRLQWRGLDARYATTLLTWDAPIPAIKGGAGIMLFRDYQGGTKLISNSFSVFYSQMVNISKTVTARMGFQAGLTNTTVDYTQLMYPQDFNNNGYQGNTYTGYGSPTYWYKDLSLGGVVYTDRLWGGVSVHHINQPVQTFYNDVNNRLPMKVSLTSGYRFTLRKATRSEVEDRLSYSITPTFHYKSQGKSDQYDLGLYSQVNWVLLGVWYRGIPFKRYQRIQNSESMVLFFGGKYRNVSAGYSYDFTISTLKSSAGSHELNITILWKYPKKSPRPMKILPCPDWHGKD